MEKVWTSYIRIHVRINLVKACNYSNQRTQTQSQLLSEILATMNSSAQWCEQMVHPMVKSWDQWISRKQKVGLRSRQHCSKVSSWRLLTHWYVSRAPTSLHCHGTAAGSNRKHLPRGTNRNQQEHRATQLNVILALLGPELNRVEELRWSSDTQNGRPVNLGSSHKPVDYSECEYMIQYMSAMRQCLADMPQGYKAI